MGEQQISMPDLQDHTIEDLPEPASPQQIDLEAIKLTDVGLARPHNEDYVEYIVPSDPQQLANRGSLYLVADGMGGHQAGEVASEGAVELVIAKYYGDTKHDAPTSLVQAFHIANQQLHLQSETEPSKQGMGTTLVAAAILGRKVYVANVGDSRAYLINNSRGIAQITEDHSWVEEQVRAGLLTPEQALRHPQRNLVTRALGSRPSVDVDLFEGEIGEGDTLLLCSDGLTGRVDDPEIGDLVLGYPPPEAARQLVALANERGGNDNITVLLVGARREGAAWREAVGAPFRREVTQRRRVVPILIGVLAIMLLAVGVLLARRYITWGTAPVTATPLPPSLTDTTAPSPEALPTEGAVVSPIQTSSPIPTELSDPTASQSPTPTLEPTAEPTNTPIPTATPVPPTATSSPSPTPEPTPRPTNTLAPTRTPVVPTVTPSPTFATPLLLDPADGERLSGKHLFIWDWQGEPLPEDHFFDLRIWSQVEDRLWTEELKRDRARGAQEPTGETEIEIELQFVPAIQEYQAGPYHWTVVVVRIPCRPISDPGCQPQIVGDWGEQRAFTYGE